VPEDKISYVHVQQEAEVLFESFPNEVFTGEVVKIDPHADPQTRTFNVFIKMPNSNLRLKPGLTGFARIKNYKTALAIPTISVMNPVGESATIFTVDQNAQVHIRRVKIGVSASGLTEIIEGLQEGDNVITTGVQFLKDGDKVQIMED
jgi:RND family efflux transporter MFP subunit